MNSVGWWQWVTLAGGRLLLLQWLQQSSLPLSQTQLAPDPGHVCMIIMMYLCIPTPQRTENLPFLSLFRGYTYIHYYYMPLPAPDRAGLSQAYCWHIPTGIGLLGRAQVHCSGFQSTLYGHQHSSFYCINQPSLVESSLVRSVWYWAPMLTAVLEFGPWACMYSLPLLPFIYH